MLQSHGDEGLFKQQMLRDEETTLLVCSLHFRIISSGLSKLLHSHRRCTAVLTGYKEEPKLNSVCEISISLIKHFILNILHVYLSNTKQ